MNTLREALRQAAEQHPESPLAADIARATNGALAEDRRASELARLGRRFNQVGYDWFREYRQFSSVTTALHVQWAETHPLLESRPQDQREVLISELARGMKLAPDENSLHRHHRDRQAGTSMGLSMLFGRIAAERENDGLLSYQSGVFVDALQDLWGYHGFLRFGFREMLTRDLSGTQIKLDTLISEVAKKYEILRNPQT